MFRSITQIIFGSTMFCGLGGGIGFSIYRKIQNNDVIDQKNHWLNFYKTAVNVGGAIH